MIVTLWWPTWPQRIPRAKLRPPPLRQSLGNGRRLQIGSLRRRLFFGKFAVWPVLLSSVIGVRRRRSSLRRLRDCSLAFGPCAAEVSGPRLLLSERSARAVLASP